MRTISSNTGEQRVSWIGLPRVRTMLGDSLGNTVDDVRKNTHRPGSQKTQGYVPDNKRKFGLDGLFYTLGCDWGAANWSEKQ